MGHISNKKPSAIFKISKLKPIVDGPNLDSSGTVIPANRGFFGMGNNNAQIGISVEPLVQLEGQTPVASSNPNSQSTFLEFSRKMCEQLFNYCSSFSVTQSQMVPQPNTHFVPISTIQQWYSNFERRLQQNPDFWKS